MVGPVYSRIDDRGDDRGDDHGHQHRSNCNYEREHRSVPFKPPPGCGADARVADRNAMKFFIPSALPAAASLPSRAQGCRFSKVRPRTQKPARPYFAMHTKTPNRYEEG